MPSTTLTLKLARLSNFKWLRGVPPALLALILSGCSGGGGIGDNLVSINEDSANEGASSDAGSPSAEGSSSAEGSTTNQNSDTQEEETIGESEIITTGSLSTPTPSTIEVNGTVFTFPDANITVNGEPGDSNDLVSGRFVRITGLVDKNGTTATASQIDYEDNVVGRIESSTAQGDTKTVTVLGQSVIVDAEDTVFSGTDFENLEQANWISASGELLSENTLRATRVEAFTAAENQEVKFAAQVTAVSENDLTLDNGLTVNTSSSALERATTINFPKSTTTTYQVGDTVQVEGTVEGTVVTASSVDTTLGFEPLDINFSPDQEITLEGYVSNWESTTGRFEVAGVQISTQSTALIPSFYTLADDLSVRIAANGDPSSDNLLSATALYVHHINTLGSITSITQATETQAAEITLQIDSDDANINDQLLSFSVTDESYFYELSDNGQESTVENRVEMGDLATGDIVDVQLLLDESHQRYVTRLQRFNETPSIEAPSITVIENGVYQTAESVTVTDYRQSSSGNLTIEINGRTQGQYGRIDASGSVTLDGTLTLSESISEAAGDTFDILNWNTLTSGSHFNDIQLPTLSPGLAWDLSNLYVTGEISVVNIPGAVSAAPSLWLDSTDMGMNYNEGDYIYKWIDKSGNNRHAVQTAVKYQPTYSTETTINSLPTVLFDRGAGLEESDFLILPVESLEEHQASVFIVYNATSFASIALYAMDQTMFVEEGELVNAQDKFIYDGFGENNADIFEFTLGVGEQYPSAYQSGTVYLNQGPIPYGADNLVSATWDLNSYYSTYVNGTKLGASSMSRQSDQFEIGTLLLGRHGEISDNPDRTMNGPIAEVLIFDHKLSDSDRQAVEHYLIEKYNLLQ